MELSTTKAGCFALRLSMTVISVGLGYFLIEAIEILNINPMGIVYIFNKRWLICRQKA